MPLAGKGMLLTSMDIDPSDETNFNRWYDREHLEERVAIDAFLEARRYIAHQGAPKYLCLYSTETFDVLDSAAYRAALAKAPKSASLLNKIGITELMMQRYREAKKSFDQSIKFDHGFADAYNNRGVVLYEEKKYGAAVKEYRRAIAIDGKSASFFSNLGAALFAKKEFEPAVVAYQQAVELDPEVFERTSRGGVQAQLPSPGDRAHYDYTVAKLYAKMGYSDRSLEYLRKALEEGYKDFNNVYKDAEFAGLRNDPRFVALMSARPPGPSRGPPPRTWPRVSARYRTGQPPSARSGPASPRPQATSPGSRPAPRSRWNVTTASSSGSPRRVPPTSSPSSGSPSHSRTTTRPGPRLRPSPPRHTGSTAGSATCPC